MRKVTLFNLLMAGSCLFLFGSPSSAKADVADVQGIGVVDFNGSRVSDIRQQALVAAEIDAIKRYSATFSASKYKLYQQNESRIIQNISSIISTPTIVDEGYRDGKSRYYVVIRASINSQRVDSEISNQNSAINSAPVGRKVSISFLFVARNTSSVKQFDARVTTVQVDHDDKVASQSAGLSGGRAKFSSSKTENSTQVTGGNTVLQADQMTYNVTSPEDMNAAMSQVFSDSGFDVADYGDVSANCAGIKPESVYKTFANSDQIAPEMRRDLFGAARRCNINTFATGSITVGIQDIDPVTGQRRVFVTVRAQVSDLSGGLPKLLASVGPLQYAGLGPNQEVASRNALILAAKEAAQEISNQLKAKGLN